MKVAADRRYSYIGPERMMSESDLELFQTQIDGIEHISPIETYNGYLLKSNDLLYEVSLVGYVGPDFLKVIGLKMVTGTFFTEADYE